jgi:GxxExxY protein
MNRKLNIAPDVDEAARQSVDALFHLHNAMGPGLLESAYGCCLEEEFKYRGIRYAREVAIPLTYRARRMDAGFRADFIVEDRVLIELKAVEGLLPVHLAQTITYLKLTGLQLGLLVNLNVPLIKDGIRRLFNPSPT